MRNPVTLFIISLLLIPAFLNAAEGPGNRTCNLQGREIALRITEEVSSELTAVDRTRIAAIAEEVCLGFAPGARNMPAQSSTPVISRPAAPQQAATAVAVPQAPEAEAGSEEDDSGLFGDIRIIDPEDRVRRPGLKRR